MRLSCTRLFSSINPCHAMLIVQGWVIFGSGRGKRSSIVPKRSQFRPPGFLAPAPEAPQPCPAPSLWNALSALRSNSRKQPSATFAPRRLWTRMSSTWPYRSTARQRQCVLPLEARGYLIEVPFVARLGPAPLQRIGEQPAEAQARLAGALIRHHAANGRDSLNLAQAGPSSDTATPYARSPRPENRSRGMDRGRPSYPARCHDTAVSANLTTPAADLGHCGLPHVGPTHAMAARSNPPCHRQLAWAYYGHSGFAPWDHRHAPALTSAEHQRHGFRTLP